GGGHGGGRAGLPPPGIAGRRVQAGHLPVLPERGPGGRGVLPDCGAPRGGEVPGP
ncbi:unnamed protein product, partial [Heterosigma akashiwo]